MAVTGLNSRQRSVIRGAIRRGQEAVNWYNAEASRHVPETNEIDLTDLVCDLMHWAAARQLDFDEVLETASMHLDAELSGDPR